MIPIEFLCLVTLVLLILLSRALFFLVDVDGYSMYPALKNGDRVLVLRFWSANWLRKGQIVVTRYVVTPWNPIRYPMEARQDRYIKRIIGLPGDTVSVHLSELPEPPRCQQHSAYDEQDCRIWRVPPRHYFVRGDSHGLDSTIVGPVPFFALCGVVVMKLKHRERLGFFRTLSADSYKTSEVSKDLGGLKHPKK